MNELGPELRDRILRGLRDVALDQEQFQRALDEKVTGVSPVVLTQGEELSSQIIELLGDGGATLVFFHFELANLYAACDEFFSF